MKKIYLLIVGILCLAGSAHAQGTLTPLYNKTGTGTGGNGIPFNTASQKTQLLYTQTDFNTPPPNGEITKLYFRCSVADANCTYTDFQVSFIQNTDLSFPSTSYYTGLTVAMVAPTITVTASNIAGGWFEIPLTAPYFQYDNTKALIVEIQYTAKSGGLSTTTSTSVGNKRCSGTSLTATTGTTNTLWNDFGLEIIPATPCGAITPGEAAATTTTPCGGDIVNLNLANHILAAGQTYQWEKSSQLAGPWNPEGGSSVSPSIFVSPAPGTTYYRCQVACGAGTPVPSQSIAINRPVPLAGPYTINSNPAIPIPANNYLSFSALATALNCAGISGDVVIDVAAGSGPYNEQFSLSNIPGSSATNTITINGNGATIANNATVATAGARHTVLLDGAEYVTINNVNIQANGATYGWGVQVMNGAHHDTIRNCTITVAATSTTSASNNAGIVGSGSQTSVATDGLFDHIAIINNIIDGGYEGIILTGDADVPSYNNYIANNTIVDFYTNGIELIDDSANVIVGNDISRTGRTTLGAFTGIELGTGCVANKIDGNKIHDSHSAATSQAAAANGIALLSANALPGFENIISNNLIYNLNSLTGTIYGLYNSNSDGAYFYHNTIVLDNAAATAGITRGFYQFTAATNIQVRNNIIYIARGGSGAKNCLYFGTTTSDITSNRNLLFMGSTTGTVGIGFYSTNQPLLTDWQAVNGNAYDQQSSAQNPNFVFNSGNYYIPTSTLISNMGTPTGFVPIDLANNTRNASTPDVGVYEFEGCFSLMNAGNYTINDAQPTAGSNFHSFPDMVAAMSCGIAGNVTIDVIAGSGPYENQQLIFPPSLVTSPSQRITINGNGATIVGNCNEFIQRATVALYGTDYVTLNNLNIDASQGTFGWGVMLNGQADHNRIAGCTITTSTTSTSNAYIGIAFTPSLTSPSAHTAPTGSYDTLINNTVTGGLYGISIYGASTSLLEGNVVMNNTMRDQSSYGILILDNNGAIVSGNDISRPTRTVTSGTVRSIYLVSEFGNNNQGVIIEKNKIHNIADAVTSSFTAVGIDVVNSDAAASTPNIVRNNVVYNMNNTGTQTGLNNSNSDNTSYYYNTVVLDNVGDASPLTTAGFSQSNPATGIDFRNNLVYITRGGTGKRYGVNLTDATTATNPLTLDNNVYYINTAGGDNHIGAIAGADKTTIVDWRNAFTPAKEVNSVGGENPQFVNPAMADFTTGNLLVNNIATPIAGITTDINNYQRSTGFPDAGAFENSQFPLGVKLLSFTASKKNQDIATHWEVTSESNMSVYEVERSYDGKTFEKIGAVNAKGNASAASYDYLDRNAVATAPGNILYYRLKMMEYSAQFIYSPVRTIKLDDGSTTVAIHPNPFTDKLTITIMSSDESEARLKIVDVQGRVLYSQTQKMLKGANTIEVNNLESLASGVYYITVDVNGKIYTEKLVK